MNMEEKKQPDGDTFVRIESPEIKAGDLISARECGYHDGYMRAIRDASLVIFACVMLAVTLSTWSFKE